ncbi:hypothetical protein [Heliophilum fasciatum]|uniref:Lipoprotein n=1 Tax=Heliophilum fasciatum TaxID=35700 RepID=A0A4R2RHG9_9FIRM|nr:hypothetical protein [Heliophilum fasciatum]MCW2278762.1 hypothetical protein [Heliophilum fasciatum]TCP62433.1 hypothetical protein EDD73_1223 [Heliophilum fasciatum]
MALHKALRLLTVTTAMALCVMLVGCNTPSTTTSPAPTAPPAASKPVPNLGITPDEFKSRFNAISEKEQYKLRIDNMVVEDGAVQNVIKYPLGEKLELIAAVNKTNGFLRNVSLIGVMDETYEAGIKIVTKATNPDLTESEYKEIYRGLSLLSDSFDFANMKTDMVMRDKRYVVKGAKAFGLTFTAQSAEDP